MVVTEQGYGDTLQFIRYLQLLKQQKQAARVVVMNRHPALRSLLAEQSEVDSVFTPPEQVPHADYWVHLLSLPRLCATQLTTIPASATGYLVVPDERKRAWHAHLSSLSGLKVGLVWQGGASFTGDRFRSLELKALRPIVRLSGVTFVVVQPGGLGKQLKSAYPELQMHDYGQEIIDFSDTAALLQQLDLVISVDTAVAHLAGALNVPVWLLVYEPAEWRWLRERNDSPWYPAMRLFRQHRAGDWQKCLERVSRDLRQKIQEASCGGYRDRADRARKQGDWQAALEWYQCILLHDPKNELGLQNSSACLQLLGRADASLLYADKLLELHPDHVAGHINRGLALLTLGRMPEGWQEYAWREQLLEMPQIGRAHV